MTGFVMFVHAVISILLIIVILMQSGRGGGLTEGFASAESMLGAQTNEFMVKATTVLGALFLLTCLGLAIVSSQKGKSLMTATTGVEEGLPVTGEIPVSESPTELPAINVPGDGAAAPAPAVEPIAVETGAEETINAVVGGEEAGAVKTEPAVSQADVLPPPAGTDEGNN